MAKKSGLGTALTFVAWLTGVIVALAVGFAMTGEGALVGGIPYIPEIVGIIAGWVVVITTIVSVVMAIMHSLR